MGKLTFEEYDARMLFKENLQRILKENGMDQIDLASKLGRSKSIVSEWYNGKKYPRVDAMQKIAKVCNVTVEELISRSEDLWSTKISRAYERASIDQRIDACKALGIHYIRAYDDKELVFNTKYYLYLAANGEIELDDVRTKISMEFTNSQNSKWKKCTIEVYNLCMKAIEHQDISILNEVEYDSEILLGPSDNYALITIQRITGQMSIPILNKQSTSSDPSAFDSIRSTLSDFDNQRH